MAFASDDARDGLPRDGAVASSRAVPAARVLREAKALPRPFTHLEETPFQVFLQPECCVLEFGFFGVTSTVRTTLAGIDALIGELTAAREQFRMERESRQAMADLIQSFTTPESDEDVPF